jgi:AraC family transcriptional regulator of arabinose operon
MIALKNSSLSTSAELTETIAMQIFWRFLGEGERLVRYSDRGYNTVEQARLFIQEHLANPLTLEDIAAAVHVSPTHLIRLFRAQLGQTPMAYVWHRRVAMGLELLRGSGLAIHIIAERCGFQSSHHFSRRVRQVAGMTATEVRTYYGGEGNG